MDAFIPLMNNLFNLTGKRFGILTAVKPFGKSINSSAVWLFKCDCGTIVQRTSRSVTQAQKAGKWSSCGCLITQNLLGKRFGRLLVISKSNSVRKKCVWTCKCDCGNEQLYLANNLIRGKTQSCGCLVAELVSISNKFPGENKREAYEYVKLIEELRGYEIDQEKLSKAHQAIASEASENSAETDHRNDC